MKAKFIRDDMRYTGSEPYPEGVSIRKHRNKMLPMWDVGAVVSHPNAFRLVQEGVAEPVDEECEVAAGVSPEQMRVKAHAYERRRRGIAPEDFYRYDRGEISHLLPNGLYAPGKNWRDYYSEGIADIDYPEVDEVEFLGDEEDDE